MSQQQSPALFPGDTIHVDFTATVDRVAGNSIGVTVNGNKYNLNPSDVDWAVLTRAPRPAPSWWPPLDGEVVENAAGVLFSVGDGQLNRIDPGVRGFVNGSPLESVDPSQFTLIYSPYGRH